MVHNVKSSIIVKSEEDLNCYIQVKPNSRLSEANILTVLRNAIQKIEDVE